MEGIVRKILRHNKNTLIVFVYTLTQSTIENGYALGKLPMAVEKQENLAKKYGIPSVNIGLAIYEDMQKTGKDISAYTIDTVHPNNAGYLLYTHRMLKELFEIQFHIQMPASPVTSRDLSHVKMVHAAKFANEDPRLAANKMNRSFLGYIYSDIPGTTLSFSFTGSIIGLYFTMEKDSGCFAYSIDDGTWQSASTWDDYCTRFARDGYKILSDSLQDGAHSLHIRVLDEKMPESEGNYIRIGAFLVG